MKIGEKVILTGKHPHAYETGVYIEDRRTAIFGMRPVVKLDNCGHGVDECFVMNENDWKPLSILSKPIRIKKVKRL